MNALERLRTAAGVLVLVCLGLLALSGWALMAGYVPSDLEAFDSVLYWRQLGGLGAMLRNLHDHVASALVVTGFLYLLLTYLAGRHRLAEPAEPTGPTEPASVLSADGPRLWWRGLTLYLVVLGFAFTGFLLPMDQDAYWGTIVRLGIVEAAPVVGPPVADLLRGGATLSASTLPRFHALHVSILPILALVLLWPWLRHLGGAGGRRSVGLWVALGGIVAAYGVAHFLPVMLELPADPADSEYVPRPEWYFLWLFQFGKYVEGAPWLRSLVLPVIGLALLAVLPWWRQTFKSRAALAAAWCLAWTSLTALAVWQDRDLPEKLDYEAAMIVRAAVDYERRCGECHGAEGRGDGSQSRVWDLDTPDFTTTKFWSDTSREKMRRIIRDGKEDMPAFGDKLAPEEIDALIVHLEESFHEASAAGLAERSESPEP